MARTPSTPTYQPANLSVDQISRAIPRLQKRISDLEMLDFSQMHERGGADIQGIKVSIEQTLEEIFGSYSTEYQRYHSAAVLSGGPLTMSYVGARGGHRGKDHHPYYERSRERSITLLKQAIQGLEERRDDLGSSMQVLEGSSGIEDVPVLPERIFVVHGRDGEPREAIARFLQLLGLEPVILHERPNKGRTLITKFHDEASDIGFAIILMTPDDVGGLDGGEQKRRARQNVIFELGFFIGKLGGGRVAALIGNEVERPSDFEGVVYIPIESDWRLPLCKELRAAGYNIDLNKVL
jgi:Predicted nucleotide-binding protein containing TIR-like domain